MLFIIIFIIKFVNHIFATLLKDQRIIKAKQTGRKFQGTEKHPEPLEPKHQVY